MSISRVSSMVALIVLVLTLLGLMRINLLYIDLREEISLKNNLLESVKTAGSDAQEDFRLSARELVKVYTEKNLFRYANASKDLITNNDRYIIFSRYLSRHSGDRVGIIKKYGKYNLKYNENINKAEVKNAERRYFYVFNGRYHNTNLCRDLAGNRGEIDLYSSMEACALSGAYPCEHCILGY